MKVYPVRTKQDQQKFELLFKASNKRDYLLWTIGINTGLRIGDILSLRVKDVTGNYLNITNQKTGKKQTIKLNKKVKEAVKEFLNSLKKYTDDTHLFISRQGSKKVMSVRRCQQIIKAAAKKLGMDHNINTHSLRKTFAWNVYNVTGHNIGLVMELLNHSKEIITLRYLCLIEAQMDKALDMLADL